MTLEQAASLLVLSLFMAGALFAEAGDPPARVARVSFITGKVSLQPSGASDWSEASLNYPVTTGDRIYTDPNSQAEFDIGSTAVRASATTDLTMANLNDQFMQLGLGEGVIRVRVYELLSGDSVEVDTPNGALTLLQPGDYRVETYPDSGATFVIVNSGALEVSGGDLSEKVGSGQAVKLTGTDPINVAFVSMPPPDAFDQWCGERDQRFASSASARYVGRETPGSYDLDVNGTWDEHPTYGPVWYPSGVPAGWAPYRNGRWVWVEPWGWTWVESEPWGFAPFHYGRWVSVGLRWGWVPGPVARRPYYAPALVAFVGGPGFSIGIGVGGGAQGWFPLGPGEPFLPWYHYGGNYLRRVNVTNVTNITNITNVNNIHYMNQTAATTVVSTETFRSGQAINRQMIRVNPGQLARAEIIPHPETTPAASALGGGRTVPNPVRAISRATIPAAPRSDSSFERPPARTNAPAERGMAGGPPQMSPRFVTRTPLPSPSPSFGARQPAMQDHPGRPLEPNQVENLQAGKPAGPMRDKEVPSHPQKTSHEKAAPQRSSGSHADSGHKK
jgi:hypothetical protein